MPNRYDWYATRARAKGNGRNALGFHASPVALTTRWYKRFTRTRTTHWAYTHTNHG